MLAKIRNGEKKAKLIFGRFGCQERFFPIQWMIHMPTYVGMKMVEFCNNTGGIMSTKIGLGKKNGKEE